MIWPATHDPRAITAFLLANPDFEFHLGDHIESTRYLAAVRRRFDEFRDGFSSPPDDRQPWAAARERFQAAVGGFAAYAGIDWSVERYWDHIPLTGKDSLRGNPAAFLGADFEPQRLWRRPTSGTTGAPTEAWWSPEFYFEINLLQVLEVAWVADLLNDDFLARPLLSLTLHDKKDHASQVWTAPDAAQGLSLRYVFDERRPETLRRAFDLIQAYSPACLIMKPNILDHLVRREPERLRQAGAEVLMIISAGADLTASVRQGAEAVVKAPIIDVYGLTELGTIGSQCAQRDGLHVWPDGTILEILTPEGALRPTGVGELVVSRIANTAMPLLRYRTGDLVDLGQGSCPCGRQGLMLRSLRGRLIGNFRLPDGGERSPTDFDPLIRQFPLEEFRMTQDARDSITVEVQLGVACEDIDGALLAIRDHVAGEFGGLMRVTVEPVRFPLAGKFQRYRIDA